MDCSHTDSWRLGTRPARPAWPTKTCPCPVHYLSSWINPQLRPAWPILPVLVLFTTCRHGSTYWMVQPTLLATYLPTTRHRSAILRLQPYPDSHNAHLVNKHNGTNLPTFLPVITPNGRERTMWDQASWTTGPQVQLLQGQLQPCTCWGRVLGFTLKTGSA